jgi:hypothetical protein
MGLCALFTASAVFAQVRHDSNEQIQDSKVAYVATYPDKSKENVLVSYEAFVSVRIWQTGAASTIRPWHPIDDRKCHVTVTSKVQRRAYIVTHSGVNAPLDQYTEVYATDRYVDRGPDKPWEIYHVTCGEVMQQFLAYGTQTKANLNTAFLSIITNDSDKDRERLRLMLKAQKLEKK